MSLSSGSLGKYLQFAKRKNNIKRQLFINLRYEKKPTSSELQNFINNFTATDFTTQGVQCLYFSIRVFLDYQEHKVAEKLTDSISLFP